MSTSAELNLEDGTPVRFLLAPGESLGTAPPSNDDLPDGMGEVVPVGSGGRAVGGRAIGALRGVLQPLGPLLGEIHQAVTATPEPPTEISVEFGIQVGQDLSLGIVGGNGQAHLTVTASWNPSPSHPPQTCDESEEG